MARAALTRIYASVELEDGTVLEDMRILFADQAAYAKAARINRWDTNDSARQNAFLAWKAGTRLGLLTSTFEEFEAGQLIDLDIAQVEAGEDDDAADPTPAS